MRRPYSAPARLVGVRQVSPPPPVPRPFTSLPPSLPALLAMCCASFPLWPGPPSPDLDAHDQDQRCVLYYAYVQHKNHAVMRVALQAGASPDTQDGRWVGTACQAQSARHSLHTYLPTYLPIYLLAGLLGERERERERRSYRG